RCASTAPSVSPPVNAGACFRVSCACTRRSAPGRRPSCASTGPGSSRSGCGQRGARGEAPSSTPSASTASTTRAGASTGRPRLVESDYRGAFGQALARFRRRALLVLLTDLSAQPVAESLLPALPLVSRDHVVVVAGVQDPHVETWARAVPEHASESYRKAAA